MDPSGSSINEDRMLTRRVAPLVGERNKRRIGAAVKGMERASYVANHKFRKDSNEPDTILFRERLMLKDRC